MRTRLVLPAAILLLMLALLAVACSDDKTAEVVPSSPPTAAAFQRFDCTKSYSGSAPVATGFPRNIIDDAGRTVALKKPPSAIASLSAGHTEMLYAIGAGGQVSAVDKTSDCPAATANLPQVDAFSPSVEAIVALHPDLVIIFYDPGELRTSLEGAGVTVLLLKAPDSVEGVLEQIEKLGDATGHPDEAENLAVAMQDRVDQISELYRGEKGPTVFHEVDNMLFTAGPGSFIADLYDTLGAKNIANSTGTAFPQMSNEAIIAAAPEVIILADEEFGESPATVAARPGWSAIPAVQSGRIHAIDTNIVSRPGPRLIEALEALGRLLYPNVKP